MKYKLKLVTKLTLVIGQKHALKILKKYYFNNGSCFDIKGTSFDTNLLLTILNIPKVQKSCNRIHVVGHSV